MSYLVLTVPELSARDFQLIQEFRKDHDQLYRIVEPHFTLVFPLSDLRKEDFISEIRRQTEGSKKFEFTVGNAIVNKDSLSDYFQVFLQPDEGYNGFIKLHDQLYEGLFSRHLRHDIPFVPHITIGNSKDKFECGKLVAKWNALDIYIKGHVTHLTAVEYQNEEITAIEKIELK